MAESISFDLIARDLASKAFKDAGGAADGFRGKLSAVSGVLTGAVGAGLTHMGEKLEETRASLKTAITDAGQSFGQFSEQIDKTVSHQEKFGHTSDDTNEALAVLVRATGNTKTALSDMDLVTEIAAVHHSSLADAANQVAKMHGGATRALKEFGINVKDNQKAAAGLAKEEALENKTSDELAKAKQHLADLLEIQHAKSKLTVADHIALRNAQAAVTKATDDHADAVHGLARMQAEGGKAMDFAAEKVLILNKIHGTAEAQADTFGGKIKGLEAKFKDYGAELGVHIGPALTVLGPALGGIGMIIEAGVIPAIVGATAAALPWIAGIAAVAAAAYLLYRNWGTIWGFIKKITSEVVGFVNDHLTLILTIALGPLGLAIGELKDHWSTVWDTVKTAVQDMWKVIEPIFKFLKRAIDDIAGPLGTVAKAAGSLVKGVGGALSHIPGLATGVTNFAGGMAVVGEDGPELAYLPRGTSIMPHPAFAAALAGGQGTAFHSVFNIVTPDPHRTAVSVNQGLRDAAFLMGV